MITPGDNPRWSTRDIAKELVHDMENHDNTALQEIASKVYDDPLFKNLNNELQKMSLPKEFGNGMLQLVDGKAEITEQSAAGGMGGGPPSGDGSGFQISNGKLLVNGKLLNGVAVRRQYAMQVDPEALADQISTQFPGINVVRLATRPEETEGVPLQGSQNTQRIDQIIRAFNAKNIGVIVDNHCSYAMASNNVSQDGAEPAWFAQLAKDNLGNKMVMFQPENEPTGTDAAIVSEQQNAYNAIRATGSNAIVAFDLAYTHSEQGWPPAIGSASPMESDPSAYDRDSNYVIDAHSYASTSTDPAKQLQTMLAQTSNLTEADGSSVPVYVGETGISIDDKHIDAQATQNLNTVWSDGTGGIAWAYNGTLSDDTVDKLCNGDGTLSSYGQEVAALIKKGAT